ncbi:MAG: hypothetical protein HZC04_01305 [Candidatus Lloydbacteria bacterium]|nr:hypothetical protein [Candidatus Lloydbacteria bacterium]
MSFEQQPSGAHERKKGVEVCLILKEKESDPLHWGGIDCFELTPDEELLIEKFDELKRNPSEEALFALNKEARELLEATGGRGDKMSVAEALINELVAFRYELKHKHHNGTVH